MNNIDLNCDLAEGGKYDHEIMPYISSCNIACGGHAGNQSTIASAINSAIQHKVKIGAHPSYPDRENFGRKPMKMDAADLKSSLISQIESVQAEAIRQGVALHHVKPHGALYNELVHDAHKAKTVLEAIQAVNPKLVVFVPPKSVIQDLAKAKMTTWVEGFADRNYEADFSLVSRQEPNAVLHEKHLIFKHVLGMVNRGEVRAKNGELLQANFKTICVHSDTQNAVEIVRFLQEKLTENNIKIN